MTAMGAKPETTDFKVNFRLAADTGHSNAKFYGIAPHRTLHRVQ
jgi:hypothetical protein